RRTRWSTSCATPPVRTAGTTATSARRSRSSSTTRSSPGGPRRTRSAPGRRWSRCWSTGCAGTAGRGRIVARPGKAAIIEQFLADGITHMFGNPGTVEQGFLDALEQFPEFHYVLTLQETVAAGIADGYARATGRPAVVQLHSGVGLGNGIGMLYQSKRGHTPLVVIAGEAGGGCDAGGA